MQELGPYFVLVRFPDSSPKIGPGVGAAIGAFDAASLTGSYLVSALDEPWTPIIADLAINLVTLGPSKALGGSTETGTARRLPTALQSLSPNPTHSGVGIDFSLATAAPVSLAIYDVAGRLVRTLVRERMPAGLHQTHWEGLDSRGTPVAVGVYVVQLRTDSEVFAQKLVLMNGK